MTSMMKLLYVCPESAGPGPGAYSVDPSPDGTNYRWMPAEDVSFYKSNRTPIRTAYATGRDFPTPSLPGPDGGELSFKFPMFGHTTSGAATQSPPATLNLFEERVLHVMGALRTLVGAAVVSTDVDELGITANAYNPQDLLPVHEAGVPDGAERTQWVHVDTETAGTPNLYGVSPEFEETPSNAAIVRSSRAFQFNFAGGGPTDAFYYVDDDGPQTLLGCRMTSFAVEEDPQQRVMVAVTYAVDRAVPGEKGSIPDPGSAPPVPAIIGANAAVYFNGNLIETKSIRFDPGIEAPPIEGRNGLNGRVGHTIVKLRPSVTLDPLSDDDYNTLMADATAGPMLLQFGAGVLSGGVLNTVCFYFAMAQVHEVSPNDDAGRKRHSIKIELVDEVMFAAGVASRAFQIAVA